MFRFVCQKDLVVVMSESNEDRSPGFKRSLTWKIAAAVLFVIVGTVIVAYSMNYCRECNSPNELAQGEGNLEVTVNDGDAPTTLSLKPSGSFVSSPPKIPATSLASTKPKVTPAKSNSFSGSFQPKTTSRVTTQRPAAKLASTKSFSPPKTQEPATSNSFTGQVNKIKNSTFAPIGNSISKPVKDSANSFASGVQSLKDSGGQFAASASNNLKESTSGLAEKTGNALRSLGNRATNSISNLTSGGTTPPSRSSFAPAKSPSTSNSFSSDTPRQPFAPSTSSAKQGPSGGFTGNLSAGPPPIRSPRTSPVTNSRPQPPAAGSSQRNSSLSRSSSLPQINTRQVGSSSALPANGTTLPTPGDRRLEGPQSPSVTIEKIAPREIQVNQPADFQLVVKNVGRIAARNVVVMDQIPAGTEFVQSTPQASRGANGQINWKFDRLEPGQEKRIRLQLRPTRQGEIGSVAEVTFSAQASMRTKVTKPVLSISHSAQPRILIGDPVVLDINVKNDGDGPAADVMIQEDLPEQLEFSEGFRELEYAIGTLAPGQSRKIRLELRAAKIGKFKNVLVAHAGGGLQTQHAVDIEVVSPQLVAQGDGPTRRFLNREATHRFSVRNSGTANATNVELVCRLPSGLRYVSTNNRGKYDENSHAVYWSLAELNSGLVANVEVATTPTEPGNQDLKFEVVSDLNQSASALCKLNVEHLIDIFFDIDDVVDPIEIGSNTSYKLKIVNQGTKTATNIQLQVAFPAGIQPTSVDGNVTNEIRGQQIAFSPITSMNPGDQIDITIHGKGISAGDHRVAVNLIADGREVNVSKQESTRVYSDR